MDSMDVPRVIKEGIYKKLKTSKKKYFILRENAANAQTCLEYHDSEKKVKPDSKPKRSVCLQSCFSINTKFDAKNPYTLVLFTQDDCLGMVFETEQEQQDWFQTMQALLSESGLPASRYDHVWQVVVKPEGLANGKTLHPGVYRLCLSKKMLILIPTNRKHTDIEFQLATIRKCAHKKTFFMLESGTAAATGAGELWMQVEDSVVAHNIHDIVLKAMRSNPVENISLFRGRSHTHGTSERPHRSSTKRNSIDSGSSTLPRHQKAKSMHVPAGEFTTSPSLKRQSQSPHKTGNIHSRPKSSFVDFRTVSPGQSPHIMSPLSQEMRDRTDSWESRGSHTTENSSVSDEPDHPLIKAGGQSGSMDTSDYLTMTSGSTSSKVSDVAETPTDGAESYMEMSSPISSAPCLKTLAASPIMPSDSGYLDMQPVNMLYKGAGSDLLRPDKVPSLLSDSESVEGFPKRTYSLGSKPVTTQPALGQSPAYMDMHCSLDKGNPRTCSAPHLYDELPETGSPYSALSSSNLSHSSSRSATPCGIPEHPSDLMEINFDGKATGSRESLSDFRSRTSSGSSRDIGYHTSSFETDFRDRTDSSCSRDSAYRIHSIDKFRHRTQTVCQDSLRTRASNLNAEENMRPRSFSHGTSRFRELSKRLKEKTLRHTSGDHAKFTKKFSKNPSRESIQDQRLSMADSEYIDINVVGTSDNDGNIVTKGNLGSQAKKPEDEYMVINPEMAGDYDIMGLKTTRHGKKTLDAVEGPADGHVTSVKMKNKPHYSRKESAFKHSSSSESVSSTSSSDHVAKGNKMAVTTGKPSLSAGNSDYFELQPGGGDTYMKFSQIQATKQPQLSSNSSSSSSHNSSSSNIPSQKAVCIEDSYSVMNPREMGAGGIYYDTDSSEPTSLAEILQGLDKVVSPIREEDNEALFGPKPAVISAEQLEILQKSPLKHEYVNINYDRKGNIGVESQKTEEKDTKNLPRKAKGPESSGVSHKGGSSGVKTDKRAWGSNPISAMHEYCEINFAENDGASASVSDISDWNKKAGKTANNESSAYDKFKSSTNVKSDSRTTGGNEKDGTKHKIKTVSTPPPFELLPMTGGTSTNNNKSISSASSTPPVEEISSLDVFNLGALPSSTSTPVRPSTTSESGNNSNQEATPNKSPTLMGPSLGQPTTKRGSVTSLASLESTSSGGTAVITQQQPRLRAHSSNVGLSSMDKTSTDRLSYQEPCVSGNMNSASDIPGETIRRQSSQASLSSIDLTVTLNYATLDLSGSQDEASFPTNLSEPQVSPGIKSRAQVLGSKKLMKSQQEIHQGPISYAEIDFEHCNISGTSLAEKD